MFEIEKLLIEDARQSEELEAIFNEAVQSFNEANVVKMDAKTLKKKLLSQSILLAAKDAGDPLYVKYAKASKAKREYRKQINTKYLAAGKKKMKEFLKARAAINKAEGKSSK